MVGWHHQLNGLSLSKLQEIVKDREAWHATVHGVAKSRTQFSNWATTSWSLGKAQFLKDCLYNALHELALNFPPQVYLLPLPINSIVTQTLSFLTWQALFNFWAFTHVTPSTCNIPLTTHCKEMSAVKAQWKPHAWVWILPPPFTIYVTSGKLLAFYKMGVIVPIPLGHSENQMNSHSWISPPHTHTKASCNY